MRYVKLMALAVMVLALAACGGGEAAEGGNGGGGGDAVTLGETITATSIVGGEISVSYPEGWVVQNELEDSGMAVFASSQEVLDMQGSQSVPAGQAGAVITVLPQESISMILGDEEFSPELMATTYAEIMSSEGMEMGSYEEVTINGQTVGRVVGAAEEGGTLILIRGLDDGSVLMLNGVTASGEVDNFDATFRAIMGSVSYTPAE